MHMSGQIPFLVIFVWNKKYDLFKYFRLRQGHGGCLRFLALKKVIVKN